MFAETWRKHWGLNEEPFAHEDADKDPVLSRVSAGAVHSSFDRIWGSPETPGPGIVFGEKGSGKSGLRLAIERRITGHNAENPTSRIFQIDYVDFDEFLEQFRRTSRVPAEPSKAAPQVATRFMLGDHLDSVLSLGVTRLVTEVLDQRKKPKGLSKKQKTELLSLASLYFHSEKMSSGEALSRLRHKLRAPGHRRRLHDLGRILVTILGVAALLVPSLVKWEVLPLENPGPAKLWYTIGGALLLGTWGWTLVSRILLKKRAMQASRGVRVLPDDYETVQNVLESIKPGARKDLVLPVAGSDASRYVLLQRFLGLLEVFDYNCAYVLLDRVDEATLFGGKEDFTRPFVERLLDHKLLQQPGLAFKLFLPIELSKMYLGASPDELKRMRLDKANTVQELRWTGQELLEIANKRLQASTPEGKAAPDLGSFLAADLPLDDVRDTLHELGTPRHCFGFLSALFGEYAKNLPEELSADAPEWGVSHKHFDLIRASWGDRARVLRRAMN